MLRYNIKYSRGKYKDLKSISNTDDDIGMLDISGFQVHFKNRYHKRIDLKFKYRRTPKNLKPLYCQRYVNMYHLNKGDVIFIPWSELFEKDGNFLFIKKYMPIRSYKSK